MDAVFPGSFDPPTLGHLNLIERASLMFDKLFVVAAENRQKHFCFSTEERMQMLKKLTESFPRVEVCSWDALMADFMRERGVSILVRGVRSAADFAYEFEVSMMYKTINPYIDTIFLPTDPRFFTIRSSSIKEIASFHGDVSSMVPPLVADALKERFLKI